jgi:peptide/nickel transport system permease protein
MLELSPDHAPAELAAEGIATADVAAVPTARKRRLGVVFWISVAWIAVVILGAILASVLPIKNPDNPLAVPALSPGVHYPLGTDDLGRDVLARIVFGARVSMIVGFTSIAIGLLVGGTLGVIAGYYKGRIGRLIMGCMDVLLAFPALVLALAIVTFLGQSLRNVVIAIGVLAVAPIARVIRASTLTFAEREFVTAARAQGAKNTRIIVREILPNVALPTLSFGLVAVAVAIVAEGGLAFLGLSVRPPTPSWGGMINEGRSYLQQAPQISLIPAAVMFLTVLAFNFVGDSLRARFDVRQGAL